MVLWTRKRPFPPVRQKKMEHRSCWENR